MQKLLLRELLLFTRVAKPLLFPLNMFVLPFVIKIIALIFPSCDKLILTKIIQIIKISYHKSSCTPCVEI